MSASVKSIVAGLAAPIAEEFGCEYVDTEYTKQGKDWMLTIFIDKPGGVTIEDCEKVSRALEPVLDEKDPVPGTYTLVVSSPGLDRPLRTERDFARAMGTVIDVKLYQPFMGTKEYTGELVSADQQGFTITSGDDEITFQMNEVAKAVPHLDI